MATHGIKTTKPKAKKLLPLVNERGEINPDFPVSETYRRAMRDFKMPPKVAQFLAQESEVTA